MELATIIGIMMIKIIKVILTFVGTFLFSWISLVKVAVYAFELGANSTSSAQYFLAFPAVALAAYAASEVDQMRK